MQRWRTLIATAPLLMLALSASYGVYKFNLYFVPLWVAVVSAAAYEMTYIALALMPVDKFSKRRAAIISVSAVVVSVLYNSLAGLFHIRPAMLDARPLWADVTLAILHGLPLAVVAYAVADLLLHRNMTASAPDEPAPQLPVLSLARQQDYPAPVAVQASTKACKPLDYHCPNCGSDLTQGQYGAAVKHGHCRQCKEVTTQ